MKKKNKWNSIALISGSHLNLNSTNGQMEDAWNGTGLIIDNDTIHISSYKITYLHRLFFFMKSLNSSIVPIFTDIWLKY